MAKKMKFEPEITQVKLNPEQAVLYCTCYSSGVKTPSRGSSGRLLCPVSPWVKSAAYYDCSGAGSTPRS